MLTPDVMERFAALDEKLPPGEYNYEHFRTKHFAHDMQRTLAKRGIRPGQLAPEFELPRAGGGSLRLSELCGTPVLLHFGSYS